MTGKTVDFPLSYHPLLPPQTLWMGSIGQNSTFFPEQHQHKPTKTFVPGQHARIQDFLSGGGGSRLLNLFYSLQRGPMVLLHIFQGDPTFSTGVQILISIETHMHVTITCDFPGGSGPLSTSGSANVHCGILARIGSDESVRPPFKLRNYKC